MIDKIVSLLEAKALTSNPKRVREIFQLRYILEPEIAAIASKSLSSKDLERIKVILETQEKGVLLDKEDAEEDLHFHMALVRATKNDVLVEMAAVLYDLLSECRVPPLESMRRKELSLQGHKEIYAALRAEDPELSRISMRKHLQEVESLLFGHLKGSST